MSFVGSPLSRCFVPIACRRPAQLPARDMGLVCRGIIWFSIVFDDDAFDLCGVLFPDDPDTKPKAVCERGQLAQQSFFPRIPSCAQRSLKFLLKC